MTGEAPLMRTGENTKTELQLAADVVKNFDFDKNTETGVSPGDPVSLSHFTGIRIIL